MSEDLYEDRDCYIVHEDEKLYEGGEVQNNGSLIRPALRQGDHSSAGTPVRKTFDRTRSIRQWGCKDRHSKVLTSRGVLRDRRIRLSVSTAIRFYDVQDRLGFDQPSRAVEWLLDKAQWALMIDPSHVGLPESCIHPLISSPSRHIDEGRRSPHLSLIKGSHPVSDQSRNVKSRSANSDTYFDPTLLYDAIRAPTCSIKEALGALNKPMDSDPLIIADGSVLHDDLVAAPLEQGDREFLYHNKPLQIVRDAPTILSLNVISAGSVHSRGAAFHFGYQHNISGAETRSCSCSCSSIQSVNVLGPAVHGRVQKPANGDHLGKRMAHAVMQTGSEDTIMSQLIGGSSGDLESPVVMINEAAAYLCSTPPFLHSFTQPAAGAYINEDSACDEALQELV